MQATGDCELAGATTCTATGRARLGTVFKIQAHVWATPVHAPISLARTLRLRKCTKPNQFSCLSHHSLRIPTRGLPAPILETLRNADGFDVTVAWGNAASLRTLSSVDAMFSLSSPTVGSILTSTVLAVSERATLGDFLGGSAVSMVSGVLDASNVTSLLAP